jgi:hypothetical protein
VCRGKSTAQQVVKTLGLLGKLKARGEVVRARRHHTSFLETTLAHRVRRASYPLAEGPVPPLGSTSTPRDRARRCRRESPRPDPSGTLDSHGLSAWYGCHPETRGACSLCLLSVPLGLRADALRAHETTGG